MEILLALIVGLAAGYTVGVEKQQRFSHKIEERYRAIIASYRKDLGL